MAKLVFLLVLILSVYVSAYPSQKNVMKLFPLRAPRAANPDTNPFHHHHDHHDHYHDDEYHHDHHRHDHHHHDDYDHHHHHHDDDYHHHHHDDDFHHHDDFIHYHDHHHFDDHDHDFHDHLHGHGYDRVYVYVDAPDTKTNNSQATIVDAVLTSVEDDPVVRSIIYDIISGRQIGQDQNIRSDIHPQIVPNTVPASDPDLTEFIRRK